MTWIAEAADIDRNVGEPEAAANLEETYARAGYRAVLLSKLQFAEENSVPAITASFSAALGQRDAALAALTQAVRDRVPAVIYLKVDPQWDPLRSDPAFQELLERVGLSSPAPSDQKPQQALVLHP